ncbi:hypothetical protein CDL15_Pgr010939 [Punica granatum]|uniref:Rad60/SUMO-like domain-containing protein n=1 Tax=Punica granatum TaxID=22663 RepID=A0A218XLI9_PUNGR|nr:hypothetical protein CDL15_Pgr010939 [Punica granatum]PKI53402.1 hypothetical protein CRG98_026191 [Punica granatum]
MLLCMLMEDYCEQMGLVFGAVRFTFNGIQVREIKSASDLVMEDADTIDAWSDIFGGYGMCTLRTWSTISVEVRK